MIVCAAIAVDDARPRVVAHATSAGRMILKLVDTGARHRAAARVCHALEERADARLRVGPQIPRRRIVSERQPRVRLAPSVATPRVQRELARTVGNDVVVGTDPRDAGHGALPPVTHNYSVALPNSALRYSA